jgi:hypothetical protein
MPPPHPLAPTASTHVRHVRHVRHAYPACHMAVRMCIQAGMRTLTFRTRPRCLACPSRASDPDEHTRPSAHRPSAVFPRQRQRRRGAADPWRARGRVSGAAPLHHSRLHRSVFDLARDFAFAYAPLALSLFARRSTPSPRRARGTRRPSPTCDGSLCRGCGAQRYQSAWAEQSGAATPTARNGESAQWQSFRQKSKACRTLRAAHGGAGRRMPMSGGQDALHDCRGTLTQALT